MKKTTPQTTRSSSRPPSSPHVSTSSSRAHSKQQQSQSSSNNDNNISSILDSNKEDEAIQKRIKDREKLIKRRLSLNYAYEQQRGESSSSFGDSNNGNFNVIDYRQRQDRDRGSQSVNNNDSNNTSKYAMDKEREGEMFTSNPNNYYSNNVNNSTIHDISVSAERLMNSSVNDDNSCYNAHERDRERETGGNEDTVKLNRNGSQSQSQSYDHENEHDRDRDRERVGNSKNQDYVESLFNQHQPQQEQLRHHQTNQYYNQHSSSFNTNNQSPNQNTNTNMKSNMNTNLNISRNTYTRNNSTEFLHLTLLLRKALSDLTHLTSELNESKESSTSKDVTITNLEGDVERLLKNVDNFNVKMEDLKAQSCLKDSEIQVLNDTIKVLEKRIETLITWCREQESLQNDTLATNKTLEKQINALTFKLRDTTQSKDIALKKVNKLNTVIQESLENINDVTEELNVNKRILKAKESENKALLVVVRRVEVEFEQFQEFQGRGVNGNASGTGYAGNFAPPSPPTQPPNFITSARTGTATAVAAAASSVSEDEVNFYVNEIERGKRDNSLLSDEIQRLRITLNNNNNNANANDLLQHKIQTLETTNTELNKHLSDQSVAFDNVTSENKALQIENENLKFDVVDLTFKLNNNGNGNSTRNSNYSPSTDTRVSSMNNMSMNESGKGDKGDYTIDVKSRSKSKYDRRKEDFDNGNVVGVKFK